MGTRSRRIGRVFGVTGVVSVLAVLMAATVRAGPGPGEVSFDPTSVEPTGRFCHPQDCGDCDDGNVCTDDECVYDCFGGFPPICGCFCVHSSNTASCDDGKECTQPDKCSSGRCVGAPSGGGPCNDRDLCTLQDHCQDGVCVGDPIDCDDGDPCTRDRCYFGTCISDCNDSLSCTQDTCDPTLGCVFIGTAPGEVWRILFMDPTTLTWLTATNSSIYNTYRGSVPASGLGGRTVERYDHVCFESGDQQWNGYTQSVDAGAPPPGEAWYYLVNGESPCGEGPLGSATDGTPIPNIAPCTTPP